MVSLAKKKSTDLFLLGISFFLSPNIPQHHIDRQNLWPKVHTSYTLDKCQQAETPKKHILTKNAPMIVLKKNVFEISSTIGF